MALQPFYVLVDALAIPVYTALHDFGRNAGKDYVRLVKLLGDDAAPAHDTVVGYPHVLAYLDILAHPYVAAYLDAFGIIDLFTNTIWQR